MCHINAQLWCHGLFSNYVVILIDLATSVFKIKIFSHVYQMSKFCAHTCSFITIFKAFYNISKVSRTVYLLITLITVNYALLQVIITLNQTLTLAYSKFMLLFSITQYLSVQLYVTRTHTNKIKCDQVGLEVSLTVFGDRELSVKSIVCPNI